MTAAMTTQEAQERLSAAVVEACRFGLNAEELRLAVELGLHDAGRLDAAAWARMGVLTWPEDAHPALSLVRVEDDMDAWDSL